MPTNEQIERFAAGPRGVRRRSTLRAAAFAGLAAITLGLGACSKQISDDDIRYAGVSDVRAFLGGGEARMLIDPRSPGRFAEGHIPGATNVGLAEINPERARNPVLGSANAFIVYGRDPGSVVAKAMVKKLLAAGYNDVRFYAGGLAEWSRTGEIETD